MVEELRRERETSTLNLSEVTAFVDGGEMFSEMRRETCKFYQVLLHSSTYTYLYM